MANNLYWADWLVGGATGSLDGISVTDAVGDGSNVPLTAGDACFVINEAHGITCYILRDSAGASEDSPTIIIPDDNTGNLWWEFVPFAIPQGACLLYLGSIIPTGWTNISGNTTPFISGQFIKRS